MPRPSYPDREKLLKVRSIRATDAQWRSWVAAAERADVPGGVHEWIRKKLDEAAMAGR